MIRRILSLAAGSAGAQAIGAMASLLAAIWLSPSDFGVWATVTSALAVVASLTNAGEINAYLSDPVETLVSRRRTGFRWNLLLAGVGLCYAVAHGLQDSVG